MMIMSEPARSVSLAALARPEGSFARDFRFVAVAERVPINDICATDPLPDAYARGYAEGAQAAAELAQTQAHATQTALHRIETALAQMDQAYADAFAQRLKDTVLGLCSAVLGDAASAPEGLSRRIAVAAAMFARSDDERMIRLHPEDLALVHGRLPEEWHCQPDPSLERGTVRVETVGGGVEDGPAQWRAALDEALRTC
jgi:flagellar assembly protein FliH